MVGLAKFSLGRPILAAAVLLALTVGLGSGLPRLHPEYGYRPLLGGSHPSIETLEEFIEIFGGGFPLLVVWSCGNDAPCEAVFDEASVRMSAALERDLLQLPHVMRVSGPATTPLLVPDDGGYSLRRFFENGRRVDDLSLIHI